MEVMLSGLPGRMATLIAEALVRDADLSLYPYALGGPTRGGTIQIGGMAVRLLSEAERDDVSYPSNLIVVDFTKPHAALGNVAWYCRRRMSCVIGTSGFDRTHAASLLEGAGCLAVMGANMSREIVLFHAMLQYAAKEFPGALADFTAQITESHQSTKVDVSATALVSARFFRELGVSSPDAAVVSLREPDQQMKFGVPASALTGHAFHSYQLSSATGATTLAFGHNLIGRESYVAGTMAALRFLVRAITRRSESSPVAPQGKVYSMVDVLTSSSPAGSRRE